MTGSRHRKAVVAVPVTACRHGHPVIDERHRVTGMSDVDDETLDHQGMAIELIDAFIERDLAGLAGLDAAGRAAQLRARQAVCAYVDEVWEGAKARGLNPATDPEWNAVAGLRDLTNALVDQASQAQTEAGDDD
jgi:hypothetical protein